MKITVTGNGRSGSWKIRGDQLGSALGARIVTHATVQDFAKDDVIIVVKRVPTQLLHEVQRSGKKWVFDALDFYPQPICSSWKRDEAIKWVKDHIAQYNPTAVVWPNRKMMEDCSDGRPSMVLYHHHRPGLQPRSVPERIARIAYEGAKPYLGKWEHALKFWCHHFGWEFVVNPTSLSEVDAVVAFRDSGYAGYAQVNWKSDVKLANAKGAGIPFIGFPEHGYMERQCGGEFWVTSQSELKTAFSAIQHCEVRKDIQTVMLENKYSIEQAAADLKEFIRGL